MCKFMCKFYMRYFLQSKQSGSRAKLWQSQYYSNLPLVTIRLPQVQG